MVFRLFNMNWCSRKVFQAVSRRIFDYVFQKFNTEVRNRSLVGRLTNREGLMLFFYHVVTGDSFSDIEHLFGYPHSDMSRTVSKVTHILSRIAEEEVQGFRRAHERIQASSEILKPDDKYLIGVTLIIDGHHIPIERVGYVPNFEHDFYSFNLHRPAVGIQLAISLDEYIVFVGSGFKALIPDISAIGEESNYFRAILKLKESERVLSDKGYKRLDTVYGLKSVLPHIKPRGGKLLPWQITRNGQLERFRRGRIERVFGYINNQFSILLKPVRHGGKLFKVRELSPNCLLDFQSPALFQAPCLNRKEHMEIG